MRANELREMSEEQLVSVRREAAEMLFRLRIQSQTEKLDTPSEKRKHRRTVAQVNTILRERQLAQA